MTCFHLLDIKLKVLLGDFPGGPVVKNLPANAGDMGDPWFGKIPRAAGQPGRGPTTEACML